MILEYYQGYIQASDIIGLKIKIGKNKEYSPNFNIIHDFRDTSFLFSESELLKLIDGLKSNSTIYGSRKAAYITKTPMQMAATTLFKVMKNEYLLDVNTVGSLTAAIEWVELSKEDYEEIENCLAELRKE
ncbi:MAG: hypothetical protein JW894_16230 [Bacteroidales bacterium]|nr:hypothetical protein [Bacteroidales bacterium]